MQLWFQEQHQFNLRGIYAVDDIGEFGASFQYGMLMERTSKGTATATTMLFPRTRRTLSAISRSIHKLRTTSMTLRMIRPGGPETLFQWGAMIMPGWWHPGDGFPRSISVTVVWTSRQYGRASCPVFNRKYYAVYRVEFHHETGPCAMGFPNAGNAFNDNSLLTLGASWAKGGWYIYTDWVFSTGNLFVGNDYGGCNYCNIYDTGGANGASGRDDMKQRFNINFGYYF